MEPGNLGKARHDIAALLNNPRFRAYSVQAIVLAGVLWLGYEAASNAIANLQKQKITSGFDFFNETAGFGISQTLISYSEQSSYGRAFLVGLLNTLLVAIVGIFLATTTGFMIGIARLSKNWLIAKIAAAYIEIFRNIPVFLQIVFWYFAVLTALPSPKESIVLGDGMFLNVRGLFVPKPVLLEGFGWFAAVLGLGLIVFINFHIWLKRRQEETGQQLRYRWTSLGVLLGYTGLAYIAAGMPIGFEEPVLQGFNYRGGVKLVPELVALLLALTIYTAAYIAEIVRAGVLAVERGQTEAAYSLGLKPGLALRLVVIPQAMRVIIPPLTNQYLNLTKNSSLAVAIGYPDLVSVFAGVTLSQTGQAVEILGITMAVYLALSLVTALVMNWYNARIALTER